MVTIYMVAQGILMIIEVTFFREISPSLQIDVSKGFNVHEIIYILGG
jgi:hypothetical protein